MKRFLVLTSGMMLVVLLLAVVAFVYVQIALAPDTDRVGVASEELVSLPTAAPHDTQSGEQVQVEPGVPDSAEPVAQLESIVPSVTQPIPLSSLPLTDTQKDLLRGAGIDPETFVITPEMVTCAEDRLGAVRFAEIVGGDAPGPTEVFTLLRCL